MTDADGKRIVHSGSKPGTSPTAERHMRYHDGTQAYLQDDQPWECPNPKDLLEDIIKNCHLISKQQK